MTDIMVGLVVLIIIGAALLYIRKEKKRGVVCIGCPSAGVCSKKHDGDGSACGCRAGE